MDEKSEIEIREKYEKCLDPNGFKEFKLKGLKEEEDVKNYDFCFECLYEFFSAAGFKSSSRLLDLGSGPTVHNVASASAFIQNIVLSELVGANREELKYWLKNEPGCLDWTPFLRRVAKAEGKRDLEAACPEIEDRIRRAVKAVVHCDILDDKVVSGEYGEKPYDVVLSCFTLETAATSKESFSAILARIRKLLKPNGTLVLIGPLYCSYWDVRNNRFHCLPIEPQDIQKALEENNYGEINLRLRDKRDEKLPFVLPEFYFLTCTKLQHPINKQ